MTGVVAQLASVDGANHLAENLCLLSLQLHLRVEGSGLRRLRGGAYGHSRKGHQIVRLNDHGVPATVLNPPRATREVDFVHVTTEH
jgi:hypothetical protein